MAPDDYIHRDPEVLGGTPVFKGTRVPIDTLIDHLKAGDTLDNFLEDFPSVERIQAEAILEFAKKSLLNESTTGAT